MSRILMASDLHDCEMVWYGVEADDRMQRMIKAFHEEYEKEPYDMLLLLGDYSLDFWMFPPYGSVINRGISFTTKFMREVFPHFPPVPIYMIPGNHEQYGHENWKRITGYDRRMTVPYGNNLFILLDNFGGDLDPTVNSDGTYTPVDVAYVREQMAAYPGTNVFLFAHDFYAREGKDFETEEFAHLLRTEPRIIALFSGHTHLSNIVNLGEKYGNKCLIYDGAFSYSRDIAHTRWGFRELRFENGCVSTAYLTPASDILLDGQMSHHDGGRQDEMVLISQ